LIRYGRIFWAMLNSDRELRPTFLPIDFRSENFFHWWWSSRSPGSQARCLFFSRCSKYEFSKASMAELGTEPLTFVELDSGIKIHRYDIDYLYSNILYVKDLLLIQRKNLLP
jgi:hypothetical protein